MYREQTEEGNQVLLPQESGLAAASVKTHLSVPGIQLYQKEERAFTSQSQERSCLTKEKDVPLGCFTHSLQELLVNNKCEK